MEKIASAKDESFREYVLTASPLRVLFTVCAPLAMYQAMQQIFKIMDTLMAAHVSASAVSAISSLTQITAMVSALGSGLAVGGCIRISESYGQGDYEMVRKRTSTLYAVTVIVSLAVAIVLIPFATPFLRLLKTPQELIDAGVGYFRVEVLSLVLSFFNTVYIGIERSRGHSKKILNLNLAVVIVKLGLSAIFVYVFQFGVLMISVASLISHGVLTAYALLTMPRDEGAFRFSFSAVGFEKKTVNPILRLSYPVAAEKILFASGKVIVNAMSGLYGALTVGALGISNNIGGFTTNLHAGTMDGASSLISQTRGAGKYKRTLQFFWHLMAIDVSIGAIGWIAINATLPWMAELFAHSKEQYDPVFADMIIQIHRYEMMGYVTLGINSAVNALLLGYGYAKLAMVLNVARVFVFRVPVLWALQQFTNMGAEATGVTMMVSNVATGIASLVVLPPVLARIRKLMKEHGE
ncbi:MAG: MATE family efflux transporter [Acetatifactor sp.]|nr:MATE family efflux transporter [Acetatifactor sp.]